MSHLPPTDDDNLIEAFDLNRARSKVEQLLPEWLTRQRWFSKGEAAPTTARVVDSEMLEVAGNEAWPQLWWTIIETSDGATYQVPFGLRPVAGIGATLLGHEHGLIGSVDDVYVYDALIDSELNKSLFAMVDAVEEVQTVRPVNAEQSNTSLVYDNRLIVKYFRRLHEGANPDLEVTKRLTEFDFAHVAPVTATWERADHDLAVCQPYLWDATDGWKLALASVRDFLGADTSGGSATVGSPSVRVDQSDPADAGGDFADEARRLGQMTAELHVALAEVFPVGDFDTESLATSLEHSGHLITGTQLESLNTLVAHLRKIEGRNAGCSIRVHGDYHLGQTLRAVSGWYVLDFEGEPARPLAERALPTSPLKDVAGMIRSMHYAGAAGLSEQQPVERKPMVDAAVAWERRNRDAFRHGYLVVDGIDELLPSDSAVLDLIARAFEVEKALYELEYERAYRPDWVAIPLSALDRLLGR